MHRGKPLYLNEERYAALTHMVKELLLALLILFPHFFFIFFIFLWEILWKNACRAMFEILGL